MGWFLPARRTRSAEIDTARNLFFVDVRRRARVCGSEPPDPTRRAAGRSAGGARPGLCGFRDAPDSSTSAAPEHCRPACCPSPPSCLYEGLARARAFGVGCKRATSRAIRHTTHSGSRRHARCWLSGRDGVLAACLRDDLIGFRGPDPRDGAVAGRLLPRLRRLGEVASAEECRQLSATRREGLLVQLHPR
jgi:hypothetical protein